MEIGGTCGWCGKRGFSTRKAARQAARRLFPEARMSAYRCHHGGTSWHFGHQPAALRHGEIDRTTWRASKRTEQVDGDATGTRCDG